MRLGAGEGRSEAPVRGLGLEKDSLPRNSGRFGEGEEREAAVKHQRCLTSAWK